jgi:hypothetical protein
LAAAGQVCDPAAVRVATEVVGQVRLEQRSELALAAFSEACAGPVAAAAERWVGTPPGYRAQIEATAVLDDVGAWLAVCPAGPGVLATAMSLAQGDARTYVFTACDLGATGWFDAAEWRAATGATVLAVLAGGRLRAAGVAAPTTRLLVRAMIGAASGSTLPGAVPPKEPEVMRYLRPEVEMDLAPAAPALEDEGGGLGGGLGPTRSEERMLMIEAHEGSVGELGMSGLTLAGFGDLPDRTCPAGGAVGLAGAPPRARVVSCPAPQWSAGALAAGGCCEVVVDVDVVGKVSAAYWGACPAALQADARAQLDRCVFGPAITNEVPRAGRVTLGWGVGARR